jgi:serine/threonine protein kinase
MLADFGISTIVAHDGDTTTTQEAAGTPNWMAPELLLEEDTVAAGSHGSAGGGTSRPTTKSDMWAFGCVCFQVNYFWLCTSPQQLITCEPKLLTGRIPFEMYRGLYQMIRAFKRSHVTPLQPDTGEVFPGVEAHQGPLMDLAKRCWDRDPEQRLTAEEAHQALGNLSVNDARPSRDEELELYAAGKGARSTATIDYRHLLSVFQRISKHVTPLASKTVGDVT